MPTFAESYCTRHRLSEDQYARAVLRRALYPQARLLYPLITLTAPDFFAADLELVSTLGRVQTIRHFHEVSVDYRHQLARADFARRNLNLRVSLRRLREIMAETLSARSQSALTAADPRSA